jgi:DNA-binding NarL/FixJ family response regulator
MSIKVFIADDHAMMREGLRLIIEAERDISVIGEAAAVSSRCGYNGYRHADT